MARLMFVSVAVLAFVSCSAHLAYGQAWSVNEAIWSSDEETVLGEPYTVVHLFMRSWRFNATPSVFVLRARCYLDGVPVVTLTFFDGGVSSDDMELFHHGTVTTRSGYRSGYRFTSYDFDDEDTSLRLDGPEAYWFLTSIAGASAYKEGPLGWDGFDFMIQVVMWRNERRSISIPLANAHETINTLPCIPTQPDPRSRYKR